MERPLCSSLEAPWPCSYGSLASASQPAWPWPALLWPASLSHLGPGPLGLGPFGLGLFSLGTPCLGLLSLGPLGLGPLDLVLLVLGPLGLSQPGLGLLGLGPHCLGPLGLLGLGPISLNKLSLGPLGLGLLGPGPIGLVQTTCPNTGRHTLQSCRPRLQSSTGSRQASAPAGKRQGTRCQAGLRRDKPRVVWRLVTNLVSGAHDREWHGNQRAAACVRIFHPCVLLSPMQLG